MPGKFDFKIYPGENYLLFAAFRCLAMSHTLCPHYAAFDGHRRIASGSLPVAALAVRHAMQAGGPGPHWIFEDATGRAVEVDLRGTDEEMLARLAPPPQAIPVDDQETPAEPRGRGRPKLGVVSREVTLLPRHWEWLSAQPGGASVALRKLVEQARREHAERDHHRQAQERTYQFLSAMAGDLPGFEEASRALFASDAARFERTIGAWPPDVRDYALRLAGIREDEAPAV
jgi:hypothetical protein